MSVVELREFWAEFRSRLVRLYLKHVPVLKDIDRLNDDYYFKRDLSIFVDIYKASKRLPHLRIWTIMSPAELVNETLEDPLTPPPKHPEHRKSVMALQEISSGSLNQRQDGFARPRTPKKSVKRQSSIQSLSRSSIASTASSSTNRPLTPQKSKRRESVQSLRYSASISGQSMTSRHSRSSGVARSGSVYRHRESLAVSSMKDIENSLSSADQEVSSSIYSFISSDPPTISPASPAPVPPPKSARRPLPTPPPLLEDDEQSSQTPPLDINRSNSPLDRKPEELWSTPECSYEITSSQTESPDLGSPRIESLNIKKSLRSQPKYVHRFMSTPDLRAKVARTKATVKEVMIMEPGSSSKPILKPPSPQKKVQMAPSTIGFAPENEVFRFDKNNVVGKSLVGWSTTKMAKPAKISSKLKLKRLFSFSGGPNNNNNASSAPSILKNHNSIESFSPSLKTTLHTNQSPVSNTTPINAVI